MNLDTYLNFVPTAITDQHALSSSQISATLFTDPDLLALYQDALAQGFKAGDFSDLVNTAGKLTVLYDPLTTGPGPDFMRQPFNYGGKINNIDPARISPLMKCDWYSTRSMMPVYFTFCASGT